MKNMKCMLHETSSMTMTKATIKGTFGGPKCTIPIQVKAYSF